MKPLTRIVDFVLEQAPGLPLAQRASIYRDLAELAANAPEAKSLRALAAEIEAVESTHRQLVLNFRANRPTA